MAEVRLDKKRGRTMKKSELTKGLESLAALATTDPQRKYLAGGLKVGLRLLPNAAARLHRVNEVLLAWQRQTYIKTLDDWFDGFTWKLFTDFTFRDEVSIEGARAIVRRFVRSLGEDKYALAAIELGSSGRVHIQMLMGGWKGTFRKGNLAAMRALIRRRHWHWGDDFYIDRYKPHNKGVHYTLKEMKWRQDDWEMIGTLKRVRRRKRGRKPRKDS